MNMKTSFVIASVLLAGVALEAAAFRINNDEYDSHKQWSGYQQADSSEGSPFAFQQNDGRFQTNENAYDQKSHHDGNNYDSNNYDGDAENPDHRDGYSSAHAGRRQNGAGGLTATMVAKVAAFQKIARDNDIAGPARYLDGALALDKDAVKMSEQGYVTFQDGAMTRLDGGRLQYLYVAPARDAVLAQYRFERVHAAGSFRSNARDAPATGRYAVAMDDVSCNVTAAFYATAGGPLPADARPARFRSADVTAHAADGTETRAFDDAFGGKHLPALQRAVSAEVARSAAGGCPMIARMKQEMRPTAAAAPAKLFDMSWTEDGVSVDVPDVVAGPLRFDSAAFQRGPAAADGAYRMRYHFALAGLRWTSPLTVRWSGKKTAAVRSVDFAADEIDVFVTVDEPSGGGQQTCGPVGAHVEVAGLRYDFNETVGPEVAAAVEGKLRRFFEHSLEKHVQESLKRELCHGDVQ